MRDRNETAALVRRLGGEENQEADRWTVKIFADYVASLGRTRYRIPIIGLASKDLERKWFTRNVSKRNADALTLH